MPRKNKPHPQAGAAKGATLPSMVSKVVNFALTKDTKPGEEGGAARYDEVNKTGTVIDTKTHGLDAAVIGALYTRKKQIGGVKKFARVTVEFSDEPFVSA